MKQRIPIVMMALAFLLTPGLIRNAHASPPNSPCNPTACRASCDTYCLSKNTVCSSVSVTQCGNACGVTGQCNFRCESGSGLNQICYCPDCPPPSGSPIFRKQETKQFSGTTCGMQEIQVTPPATPEATPEAKPEAEPAAKPAPQPETKPAPCP